MTVTGRGEVYKNYEPNIKIESDECVEELKHSRIMWGREWYWVGILFIYVCVCRCYAIIPTLSKPWSWQYVPCEGEGEGEGEARRGSYLYIEKEKEQDSFFLGFNLKRNNGVVQRQKT